MKKIRILIVEDHTVVRQAFHSMLKLEEDFEVVGEANDGRSAVAMAGKLQPQIVLMDIAMPGMNGLEATRRILQKAPDVKIIILSAHRDDAYIEQALSWGASGFLLKQDSASKICDAIRKVVRGKTAFSGTLARHHQRILRNAGELPDTPMKAPPTLTPREREVLQLIAEGKANKETSALLGIGIKTVEKHRGHLAAKLDLHGTAEITRYAIQVGIIANPRTQYLLNS